MYGVFDHVVEGDDVVGCGDSLGVATLCFGDQVVFDSVLGEALV